MCYKRAKSHFMLMFSFVVLQQFDSGQSVRLCEKHEDLPSGSIIIHAEE